MNLNELAQYIGEEEKTGQVLREIGILKSYTVSPCPFCGENHIGRGMSFNFKPEYELNNNNSDTRDYLSDLSHKASLKNGVLSSETAFFIAIEKPAKCVRDPDIILNELPIGWSDQFLNR
jgi:hypothetical protein